MFPLTSFLIFIYTSSHACLGVAQAEHPDPSEESRTDDLQLLQESLTVSRSQRRARDSHCLPSSQSFKLGQHLTEEQLLAKLQLAKDARQQWEDHVAALEALLAAPRKITDEVHLRSRTTERSRSVSNLLYTIFVILVSCGGLLFAVGSAMKYEKQRKKHDAPWYHHNETLHKISITTAFLWYIIGTFLCTNVILFNTERHLTIAESLYLSVQIMTTVGYGDLTPVTKSGQVFMIFYCFGGVALTGVLVTQVVEWYMEKSENKFIRIFGEGREHIAIAVPAVLSVLAGTVLFTCLPGDRRNVLEAFYMSTITLLTIGFGDFHPVSETGMVIASIWMVIGVTFVAKGLVDFVDSAFQAKRRYRSKAAAYKYFNEVSGVDGNLAIWEFLRFELVHNGLDDDDFMEARRKFDKFDSSRDGKMDFKEFSAYAAVCFS